jgi:cell filamentation protein
MSDRYRAAGNQSGLPSGIEGTVLPNRLGLTEPDHLAEAELLLLGQIYEAVLIDELPNRSISIQDLFDWHRRWLGNLYEWAGEQRSVNVSKGGFMFANAALIPQLLKQFERDCLARFTPCYDLKGEALAEAIAVTHVEIILIHPVREGNGRLSRLLADVMAVQAGHDPLDYSVWDADKEGYFAAIRAGQGNDYGPMRELVRIALKS